MKHKLLKQTRRAPCSCAQHPFFALCCMKKPIKLRKSSTQSPKERLGVQPAGLHPLLPLAYKKETKMLPQTCGFQPALLTQANWVRVALSIKEQVL